MRNRNNKKNVLIQTNNIKIASSKTANDNVGYTLSPIL